MYPLLQADPARSAWIEATVTELARFGEQHRAELDAANRDKQFPRELYREFGKLGYLGPLVPAAHGGLGGGVAEYVVISEEVGRHGLVSGQIAAQGQRWLLDWGTDEQKERWLRGIATGEAVFSESISEKNAGSSFKAMAATATRDGGDWLLTGRKTHVNLGADCDVTLFYAIAEEGLTSFLVDMSLPGIQSAVTDAIGLRLIRTADVDFDRVRVPDSARLGPAGGGLQTFLSTFNISRLGNAAELIGLGLALAGARPALRDRAAGRRQRGHRLPGHPVDDRRHVDRAAGRVAGPRRRRGRAPARRGHRAAHDRGQAPRDHRGRAGVRRRLQPDRRARAVLRRAVHRHRQ